MQATDVVHDQPFLINIHDQELFCFLSSELVELSAETKAVIGREYSMPCGVLLGSTFIKQLL